MPVFDDSRSTVVQGPNGPVTIPSQVAGMFPGAAVIPPPQPPVDPSQVPVTSPVQVPDAGPEVAPRPSTTPVVAPGPDLGTQPVAATPIVQASPAKMLADASIGESKAIDQQQGAIDKSAQAEADTYAKQAAVMAARDAQVQKIVEERAQIAAANAKQLNDRMTARDAEAAAIANTRIDRTADHPVWAAIGVALGALGGAMAARETKTQFHNIAFDTLMQQIKTKVDGQMEDLDNRRKNLAAMNAGITDQRAINSDRLHDIDVRKDAAIQQASQMVDTMATQMKSPLALANAADLKGKLDMERQKLREASAERIQAQQNVERARAQAAQQHSESIAVQLRGQNLEDRRFYYGQDVGERDRMAAIAAKALEAQDKATEAKLKKVQELGVRDPITGNTILNRSGEEKMSQADRIEAAARRADDPAQSAKLNAQAQQLRDSALTNDAATAINPAEQKEASAATQYAAGVTSRANKAIQMLKGDPSSFDRDEWAKVAVEIDGIQREYAAGGKERLSPLALKSMGTIMGIDPTSMWSRSVDKEKAISALTELKQSAAASAVRKMHGAGIQSGWSPERPEDDVSFGGKTSASAAEDATPGAATRGILRLTNPIGSRADRIIESEQSAAQDEANSRRGPSGRTSDYGLDPADDEKIRGLIDKSAKVGHAAYDGIVDTLKVPLENDRLSTQTAKLIRDQDPKLFADIVAALPPMRRDEVLAAVRPVPLVPADAALTPAAEAKLAAQNARIKLGQSADPSQPTPIAPVTPDEIPAFLRSMSPEMRARVLEYAKTNGFQ